jgi:hypothetical protein
MALGIDVSLGTSPTPQLLNFKFKGLTPQLRRRNTYSRFLEYYLQSGNFLVFSEDFEKSGKIWWVWRDRGCTPHPVVLQGTGYHVNCQPQRGAMK